MDGNQKRLMKGLQGGDKTIDICKCGRYYKTLVIKHWPHHKTKLEFSECLACRSKNESNDSDS